VTPAFRRHAVGRKMLQCTRFDKQEGFISAVRFLHDNARDIAPTRRMYSFPYASII